MTPQFVEIRVPVPVAPFLLPWCRTAVARLLVCGAYYGLRWVREVAREVAWWAPGVVHEVAEGRVRVRIAAAVAAAAAVVLVRSGLYAVVGEEEYQEDYRVERFQGQGAACRELVSSIRECCRAEGGGRSLRAFAGLRGDGRHLQRSS